MDSALTPLDTPRGFTLVEMLVVLSIIAVITTIALFGQTGFNRSVLLTDTAYSVALSLREAQSLGLSSRKYSSIQNAGYGVRFAGGGSYLMFADIGGGSPLTSCPTGTDGQPDEKPGNCRYDSGIDGTVQNYTFSRGFTVREFCGTATSGGQRICSSSGSPLTALDIIFIRSNTTDTIMTGQQGGASVALRSAEVYLQDADGISTRGICISQVGQVSVTFGTCP